MYYSRALSTLPADQSQPANAIATGESAQTGKTLELLQLEAKVHLLCKSHQAGNALRMLLAHDKWDKAMRLIEKRIDMENTFDHHCMKLRNAQESANNTLVGQEGHPASSLAAVVGQRQFDFAAQSVDQKREKLEHFELFHILLTTCLERRDAERLSKCWQFMPKTFSVFDLLRFIKNTLGQSDSSTSSSSSSISTCKEPIFITTAAASSSTQNDGAEGISSSSSSSTTTKYLTVEDVRPQLAKMFAVMEQEESIKRLHLLELMKAKKREQEESANEEREREEQEERELAKKRHSSRRESGSNRSGGAAKDIVSIFDVLNK